MSAHLAIHATPPLSPLPASDVESLYLASVFQLEKSSGWDMVTADWSENGGQLPYVTDGPHNVPLDRLFSQIDISDPDSWLSEEQKAEALSWVAYIEGKVTDLVHHTLYSLPPNYPATVGKAHSANLGWPYKFYIPQRLRAIHKTRLQHVGLWGLGGMHDADLADQDRKRLEEVYVQAPGGTVAPRAWTGWGAGRRFEEARRKKTEEELVRIAKRVFEVLERRLSSNPFFFGDGPSTPDLKLFANLSLVLDIDMPNTLLPTLLKFHFPSIVAHHARVSELLFGSRGWSAIEVSIPPSPPRKTWWETFEGLKPFSWKTSKSSAQRRRGLDETEEEDDKIFTRARWLWYAGAAGAMVTYIFASGIIAVQFGGEEEEDDEEEIWEVVGPDGEVEELEILEDEEE